MRVCDKTSALVDKYRGIVTGVGVKTFGSLFTGFGGADLGAIAAGLTPLWGNELDPAIAEVGNANLGGHIRVGDVLSQDPNDYERVDTMHMSPPCTRASVANSSADVDENGLRESALDIALANKCIQFVETLQPQIVTLENVWGYRKFQSWRGGRKCEGIEQALFRLGYWVSVDHVNAADMGVPQTRKRMIVRAVRGGWVPMLPPAEKWIGWYEAIKDLIPTLPDSQFAPWQLARLPEELRTMLVGSGGYDGGIVTVEPDEPAMTITANTNQGQLRSVLFANTGGSESFGDHHTPGDQPAGTITTQSLGRARAFLMGKNQDKFGDGIRQWSEPAQTIGANEHGSKAFVVDCKNTGRDTTIRDGSEPMFTVLTDDRPSHDSRAALSCGRVVAMTPRCLARFQSFPDSYVLPDSKTLAAKGIGNAVPPLVMQKILEQLCNH